MSAIFLKILNLSISASFLIAAAVLVRFLLKKAPKWISCFLWALVAVRLVVPFSLESAVSLAPRAQTIPEDIMLMETPEVETGIGFVNEAVNPTIRTLFTPELGHSMNPLQIVIPLLAAVWLAGVGAMLLYAFISFSNLRHRVSASIELEHGVFACDQVASPFILGLFRPRIYVPSGLSGDTLESVLAHERAHLARRDHIWKPVGFALLAVYWFSPLCWLAYILLCRDIEAACDEKVIKTYDRAHVAAYSQALLACASPRRSIAACPLAFGEVGVKARIKGILNYKKPAFWLILAAIAACAVLAVCFLTNPKQARALPFGREFFVSEILYDSGAGEGGLTAQEAPIYRVTADGELYILEDKQSENWLRAGKFEEIKLTKDNFDNYFSGSSARSAASPIRSANARAWRLIVSDTENSVFYYLLFQHDGGVRLTYGYHDKEGERDPDSDDSSIRWLFALESPVQPEKSDEPDLSFLNYENAVPLAADMESVPAIWYPPDENTEESFIVLGSVEGSALARLLDLAEWEQCAPPWEAQPSPGSIEFLIEDEYRITIYQAHRLAKVVYNGDTRWYVRGRTEYEDATALFQKADGAGLVVNERFDEESLREAYPAYFDLDASGGLTVCVWQMAAGSYSCVLLPGTGLEISSADLWGLKSVSIEKMRMILASYGLSQDGIEIVPVRMPHSSYYYEIDGAYTASVRSMFFPDGES
ncbi:MAG: hypothetical protein II727_07800 [Oscillospiraceae bacterium]|nr:hypothetical protein [Oscillospiraceae bacterium]